MLLITVTSGHRMSSVHPLRGNYHVYGKTVIQNDILAPRSTMVCDTWCLIRWMLPRAKSHQLMRGEGYIQPLSVASKRAMSFLGRHLVPSHPLRIVKERKSKKRRKGGPLSMFESSNPCLSQVSLFFLFFPFFLAYPGRVFFFTALGLPSFLFPIL